MPRRTFPKYLPKPSQNANKWLGARLVQERGVRPTSAIAEAAEFKERTIAALERGELPISLGELHLVIERGYGTTLTSLLSEYYEFDRAELYPDPKRPPSPFLRPVYYRVRYRADPNYAAGPFFVGGDPARYLWAIPVRALSGQRLLTEFLELPVYKRKTGAGQTDAKTHAGEEVIHVIEGRIQVVFTEHGFEPTLEAGHHIHFQSEHRHFVRNAGETSALLLVVRQHLVRL